MAEMPLKVAYFTMRYPTLSQTFIQREVEALRGHGLDVVVYPCWQIGSQPASGHAFAQPTAPIQTLQWKDCLGLPLGLATHLLASPARWSAALKILLANRPQAFEGWFMTTWGAAYAVARRRALLRTRPDHFHGAWATAPATIAMVLAREAGLGFSFGAHAYDVYRDGGDPLLRIKLRSGRFVHTTTEQTREHLLRLEPTARVLLARRGLVNLPPLRDASPFRGPIRLLSVGRLVPKKGHCHQLAACASLKRQGIAAHLRIVGDGPLLAPLTELRDEIGLQQEVEFCGAVPPKAVAAHYGWADLFWHTGIVDPEGDRDGLPNVIPEAMSHGLPVISCREGGVLEAVHHGKTGWTVEVMDTEDLARAVVMLRDDDALRERLIRGARAWVEAEFVIQTNAGLIAKAMREAAGKVL